jgi:methylmalonyl-CoA/ethylmalonyl-CoA epimerase
MAKILKIHHIGIAVNDSVTATNFWSTAMGLSVDHIESVPAQKSQVTFLPVGETEVELVQPLSEDSTVAKFIAEHGQGVHHICFQVDNIVEMLNELKIKGIRLINETPITEKGRMMAFIHPKSTGGVLVELYEVI